MPTPERLRYPHRAAVLIAGLPGAGKSTFLMRLYGLRNDEVEPKEVGDVLVIDSQQTRNWWARFLGPVPPQARTPITQVTHVWRISRAILRARSVVIHSRGTWPHVLYGYAWLARLRGTGLHLILLDVEPGVARAGQYARGRVVTEVTFNRHCRRWRSVLERARTGTVSPAASVTILDREAADQVLGIDFDTTRDADERD